MDLGQTMREVFGPPSLVGLVALVAVMGSSACSTRPALADLSSGSLALDMSQAPGGRFWLVVVANDKTMDQTPNCPLPAPKATATLNGVPLARLTGFIPGEASYNRDCIVEFGFPGGWLAGTQRTKDAVEPGGDLPAAARSKGPAVLRLQDHSARWVLELPDAFTKRALILEVPADGVLRRGQTAVLKRLPASDQISAAPAAVRLRAPTMPPAEALTIREGVAVQGNRVTFTVPPNLPSRFDADVVVEILNDVQPAMVRCPVSECSVTIDYLEPTPLVVSLEPR
jgi:hypothetical protein